ncbi:DUF6461 domain-containing protein [Paractinoplanes maris]|uniref:DUF6461 domain-containing protein n=1 Tax=Paractinoplanes maris TaxID=1734446 RepID=UPI00201FFD67|nr:DUF6461 domain-containing protein [Actinoplanes maris]
MPSRTDELAAFVAAAIPVLRVRVAAGPAGSLGRLGLPDENRRNWGMPWPEPASMSVLRTLSPLAAERLLGALELTIAGYDWGAAPDVLDGLPAPPERFGYATASLGGIRESETTSAATLLESYRVGIIDRTVALVREMAAHPVTAPLLMVPAGVTDEDGVAAAHGSAYLALAVAVAGAVVHQAGAATMLDETAATVGLGAGAAALLLGEVPMPPRYAEALLAKRRAEYQLPSRSSAHVAVAGHRFGLIEHEFPERADFSGNGLADATAGGVVIRTGTADGHVQVQVAVLAEAPSDDDEDFQDDDWEEIVDVSWPATEGAASIIGPGPRARGLDRVTPPWPGDYRIRVRARGRDEADAHYEAYNLAVWSAPAAPDTVHKRTDRLGHRLRGEPEPPARPSRPEHAYRWVDRGSLSQAATVTVVTGSALPQVLRTFGADPGRPQPFDEIERELNETFQYGAGPWVTALEVDGVVLVVEFNGYVGSDEGVLRAASSGGRAASMYWNVNMLTRLSFAEGGRLLAAFEYLDDNDALPPEIDAVLAGLDFDDSGERIGKGLVAVERFTGRGITEADVARIEEAGVGYRVAG